MKKYIVTLTKEEREVLGSLVSKGKHQKWLSSFGQFFLFLSGVSACC